MDARAPDAAGPIAADPPWPLVATPEAFAALARSSPWRWHSVRFTLRSPGEPGDGQPVRAYLRRPGDMRIESPDGALIAVTRDGAGGGVGVPLRRVRPVTGLMTGDGPQRYPDGAVAAGQVPYQAAQQPVPSPAPAQAPVPAPAPAAMPALAPEPVPPGSPVPRAADRWRERLGQLPAPLLRPDGLVARRPEGETIGDFDAPMYRDYFWVALLDPRELADGRDQRSARWRAGTVINSVTEVDHHGRPAWQALVTPTEYYQPRCGCCSLLRERGVDLAEWGADHDAMLAVYPDHTVVRLDRQTGICVLTRAVGGSIDGRGHQVVIEAVDERLDDVLFEAEAEAEAGASRPAHAGAEQVGGSPGTVGNDTMTPPTTVDFAPGMPKEQM